MDVGGVGPSEWRCQEAASVADDVPNQVILWAHIVNGTSFWVDGEETAASDAMALLRAFQAAGRSDRQGPQCSFSYVTPELAVQAEVFFLLLLSFLEMPESGTRAR